MAPIPNLTLTSFMVMMLSCLLLLSPGGLCTSSRNAIYSDIDKGLLGYDQSLSTGDYRLTMRKDCNLVLSGKYSRVLWSSQSPSPGSKCYLTLTSTGEPIIYADKGSEGTRAIWRGGTQSVEGSYALVVKSEGTINVYGPILWSSKGVTVGAWSGPPFTNQAFDSILSTGQVASTGTIIQNDKYVLVLHENCNLTLSDMLLGETLWSTNKVVAGGNCELTLQDDGELVIKYGEVGTLLWTSGAPGPPASDYVLALRPDGKLVIYGPSIWVRPKNTKQMTGDAAAEKYWNIIATAIGK